jgi:hypothetical protein
MFKKPPNQAACWAKQQRRHVNLERVALNRFFMICSESVCVINELNKLRRNLTSLICVSIANFELLNLTVPAPETAVL